MSKKHNSPASLVIGSIVLCVLVAAGIGGLWFWKERSEWRELCGLIDAVLAYQRDMGYPPGSVGELRGHWSEDGAVKYYEIKKGGEGVQIWRKSSVPSANPENLCVEIRGTHVIMVSVSRTISR